MSKFKVGDRVRVVKGAPRHLLNEEAEIAEVHGYLYYLKYRTESSFLSIEEEYIYPSDTPEFTTPPAESITYQVNDLTVTMTKGTLTINGTTLNAAHAETLVSLIKEFVV